MNFSIVGDFRLPVLRALTAQTIKDQDQTSVFTQQNPPAAAVRAKDAYRPCPEDVYSLWVKTKTDVNCTRMVCIYISLISGNKCTNAQFYVE